MLWHSAATCKVSKFSHFFAFFSGTTGLILIKLWFLFMLWHSAANCKVSKFSHFFAFFWKLLVFIKHWFLFMLWHSAANCKVSKFFHFFAFFSGTTGLHLDKSFIFVHAVAFCSHLQCFTNFSLFCIFLRNYWCWSWSNFDFCLCCATLQPIVKFQNFFTFLHFSEELLVFIKHWFLFMLWHSAASCKVSNFSVFCIVLRNYWLILINLSILFMLCHSAATCNVSKFSSLFCIFLRNYWCYLDQTLIFVYGVPLCSQL